MTQLSPPPVEPRPTAAAFAGALMHPALLEWMGKIGQVPKDQQGFKNAVMALAAMSADAYTLAKYAETEWEWKVDTQCVYVIGYAIEEARQTLPAEIAKWVVRSGVRFPADVKDSVLFFEGDELVHGIVQNLKPATAEAVVAVVESLDLRNRETRCVLLRAEQVIPRESVDRTLKTLHEKREAAEAGQASAS